MKKASKKSTMQKQSVIRVAVITLALLAIPLLAMLLEWQFIDPGNAQTEQVNWDAMDFIIMGLLIFGIGMLYEYAALKVTGGVNRFFVAIGLLVVFILIWVELAVGIFGSPFAGS